MSESGMVCVTGATGFTGPYVVQALLSAGESVRCLVRKTSRIDFLKKKNVSYIEGDLEHGEGLVEALSGARALVSVSHIRYAPVLIQACREAGVQRVVLLSSTWRFSSIKTPEVEAVIAGEEAIEASDLDATLIRPTMIYGPGQDRNISRLRDYVRKRRVLPIFGNGESLVQPVYVEDVADAVVGALLREGSTRQAYELGGAQPMTFTRMVDTLCRLVGTTVIKIYVPLWVAVPLIRLYGQLTRSSAVQVDQVQRMGEDRAFDISKAQRDLGYAPRTFEAGVREAMRVNGEV